jgi:hypothetical protein
MWIGKDSSLKIFLVKLRLLSTLRTTAKRLSVIANKKDEELLAIVSRIVTR